MTYGIGQVFYKQDGIDYQFPTATMGGGNVLVSDLAPDGDGFVGVGFSHLDTGIEIGSVYDCVKGATAVDVECEFILRFDKVESIDVVISRLKAARVHLIEKGQCEKDV